ncbi:hypothetical protein [Marinoscillum sp. MHG1-6]|uniref:hypothetical protein n=1 Tax=Marinoscillum sp. MHG1-6 TaxID=2959627 RepID=UPI0021583F1A|nr:hypothetical protein [Marinoscillum sp. MHG1-6]
MKQMKVRKKYLMGRIVTNDQIWRVAISSLKSRKVVKLPNPRNSIYNVLRCESLIPERRKSLEAQKLAEWAV